MAGLAGIISEQEQGCEVLLHWMVLSMQDDGHCPPRLHLEPELGVYAGWSESDNSLTDPRISVNKLRDGALVVSGKCFVHRHNGSDASAGNGSWLIDLYEQQGIKCFEKL